jgi:hypothetical protein
MTYLLDTVPACGLHIDSVRLLLKGDIKLGMTNPLLSIRANPLVPDNHYQSLPEECITDY